MRFKTQKSKFFILSVSFALCALPVFALLTYAEEPKKLEPIIINGDRVEYVTESKDFTATDNVEVIYKDTKLTCDKLTLNTETKDAVAEGNARLEEADGIIEGKKLIYNFNTKVGTIIDADFRSNPYFGKAEQLNKVSDDEFITRRGYMTTCSYDNPHYRIKTRRMNFFPGDKVQTRDSIFYIGRVPLLCIPRYSHSLRDPMMHVQLMPGKSKDWGAYLLSAWRYNLTEDVSGRIYFDLRDKLGVAEGFGVNYKTLDFGKGDFKLYYTHEVQRRKYFYENWQAHLGAPSEDDNKSKPLGIYERYFIRARHKWDPDDMTNARIEYYKIVDSKRALLGSGNNFLKDYFFREYEKDSMPLSYISVHRAFDYSSIDFLIQKRVNRWYAQEEKLPQINFNLSSVQLGNSPFYFNNSSSYVNFNSKQPVPSDEGNDVTYNKYDTTNKFSLPTKAAFINLTPFVSMQNTIYDKKNVYGSTHYLTYSFGSDLSTKFYRIFAVKTNFLKLDINALRHIITPTVGYAYNNTSTMPSEKLNLGGNSSLGSQSAALSLENRLQTKRNGQKVDLATFTTATAYNINPKTGDKMGSNLSDFLFDLELRPYSWLRFDADTTYKHTGNRSDTGYKHFSNANYDITFDFAEGRSIAIGQRYQRKGGNDITYSFNWRLNPKWKFSFYQRRNRGHSPSLRRGLREQEYIISRNFHCWDVDFTYNVRTGSGASVWLVFRLKAFPELEFEYNQEYHKPKPGSQSNP